MMHLNIPKSTVTKLISNDWYIRKKIRIKLLYGIYRTPKTLKKPENNYLIEKNSTDKN